MRERWEMLGDVRKKEAQWAQFALASFDLPIVAGSKKEKFRACNL